MTDGIAKLYKMFINFDQIINDMEKVQTVICLKS